MLRLLAEMSTLESGITAWLFGKHLPRANVGHPVKEWLTVCCFCVTSTDTPCESLIESLHEKEEEREGSSNGVAV